MKNELHTANSPYDIQDNEFMSDEVLKVFAYILKYRYE